eukprot:TRINITY_DN14487_c0_g4_i1.p1 TRINITY_DN14487_c0_g4~~TRINITY_DN14487_c0_g4_i1.p1  ORF type:complete len:847 (-),score=158.46 TRINITY_DN14487_c0_g4_i1:115-2655(-)
MGGPLLRFWTQGRRLMPRRGKLLGALSRSLRWLQSLPAGIVILHFVLLLQLSEASQICEGDGEQARVAIVGAGIAGLVAAQTLQRAGCSVVVFEAHDEAGGRASRRLRRGGAFDGEAVGAHWIHGGEANRVLQALVSFFGLRQRWVGGTPSIQGDRSRIRLFRHGKELPREAVDRSFHLFAHALLDLEDQVTDKVEKGSQARSIPEEWRELLASGGYSALDRALLMWQMRSDMHQNYGQDLYSYPVERYVQYVEFGSFSDSDIGCPAPAGDSEDTASTSVHSRRSGDTVIVGGYSALVERLVEDLRDLRLRARVNAIRDEGSAGVVLDLVNENADGTSTNSSFRAGAVIVTVPVAVLRAGAINFDPPLDAAKAQELARFTTSSFTELLLRFRPEEFPVDPAAYLLTRTVPRIRENATLTDYCVSRAPAPELRCYPSGSSGVFAAQLAAESTDPSRNRLRAEVLKELRLMYPTLSDDAVEAVEVVAWREDPLALGAWPSRIGSDDLAEDDEFGMVVLGQPHGRVAFAGDYACATAAATEAAASTGARAALRLLPAAVRRHLNSSAWPMFAEDLTSICEPSPPRLPPPPPAQTCSAQQQHLQVSEFQGRCRLLKCLIGGRVPSLLRPWKGLSAAERNLWTSLGWYKDAWEAHAPLPGIVRCSWHALGRAPKKAARALGFDALLWPKKAHRWQQLIACRRAPRFAEAQVEFLQNNASRAQRRSLASLNADPLYWVVDAHKDRDWDQLNTTELSILERMGVSDNLWIEDVEQPFPYDHGDKLQCNVPSVGLEWSELNGTTSMTLWATLGFDSEKWGSSDVPHYTWEDLSYVEKRAAENLGYTEELWDMDM